MSQSTVQWSGWTTISMHNVDWANRVSCCCCCCGCFLMDFCDYSSSTTLNELPQDKQIEQVCLLCTGESLSNRVSQSLGEHIVTEKWAVYLPCWSTPAIQINMNNNNNVAKKILLCIFIVAPAWWPIIVGTEPQTHQLYQAMLINDDDHDQWTTRGFVDERTDVPREALWKIGGFN